MTSPLPPNHPESVPQETEILAALIQRTKWKFSWTLARIYPHEYTTKKAASPQDHEKLITCIEQYGVPQTLQLTSGSTSTSKGASTGTWGNPESDNPEDWPDVINRCWVDIRKHAENVAHTWTPEEVQLQMRIWEIQIEKKAQASPQPKDSS